MGLLERQKLKDEIEAEKARRALLELQARPPREGGGGGRQTEKETETQAKFVRLMVCPL